MSDEIRRVRLEKITKLRALGVDPFPAKKPARTHSCVDARDFAAKNQGGTVAVAGRVMLRRVMGGIAFLTLRDASGEVQVTLKKGETGLAREGKSTELARKAILIHGFCGHGEDEWQPWLRENLTAAGWEVRSPTLPSPDHPDFDETMDFLREKTADFGPEDVVVGHSLGAFFALKLAEEKEFGGIFLAAPPLGEPYPERVRDALAAGADLPSVFKVIEHGIAFEKIRAARRVTFLDARDPWFDAKKVRGFLPDWDARTLDIGNHFNQPEFPELLAEILGGKSAAPLRVLLTSAGLDAAGSGAPTATGKKFLEILGKNPAEAKILFVTASGTGDPEEQKYIDLSRAELQNLGILDKNIFEENLREKFSWGDFDGIYVCGGNTFQLLDRIRRSGADKIFAKKIRAGMPFVGVSAGSIILGPTVKTAADGEEPDENLVGLTDFAGLGIAPFEIWPHFSPADENLFAEFSKKSAAEVRPIRDGEAILWDGRTATTIRESDDEKSPVGNQPDFPELCDLLDRGDLIAATGETFLTKKGEPSILAREIRFLAKSVRPLPDKVAGLVDEDARFRRREIDFLMNPESRRAVEICSDLERLVREFFWSKDFREMRIPVLENVASGTAAKPFKTHINAYDQDVFLRIASGEIPLKKLTVSGFEKTFHLGPVFRNEGVDPGHNPEFNMVEAYWAYHDYGDLMGLMEEFFGQVHKKILGGKPVVRDGEELDFSGPFPRMTFHEALAELGGIDPASVPDEASARAVAEAQKIDVSKKVGYAEVLDELYKKTARPKLRQPTWLTDYPRELIPLAKRHPDRPDLIRSAQLVVQGSELVKLYSELTDPVEQAENFEHSDALEARGAEEAITGDADFVEAMEYGMPPIVGMGMGIETTARMLAGVPDLREVILFPFMRPRGGGEKS